MKLNKVTLTGTIFAMTLTVGLTAQTAHAAHTDDFDGDYRMARANVGLGWSSSAMDFSKEADGESDSKSVAHERAAASVDSPVVTPPGDGRPDRRPW